MKQLIARRTENAIAEAGRIDIYVVIAKEHPPATLCANQQFRDPDYRD
jgi:hypothetical protein